MKGFEELVDPPKGKKKKKGKKGEDPEDPEDPEYGLINRDYDLYSPGAGGTTGETLDDADSLDDILRADDGGFIGLTREYLTISGFYAEQKKKKK